MADQHNANIPVATNTLASDVPDIKENLEYHKDVFQVITSGWSNTTTDDIVPMRGVTTLSAATSQTITMTKSDGSPEKGIHRVTLILDRSVTSSGVRLRFNNDSGNNYKHYVRYEADGAAAYVATTKSDSVNNILLTTLYGTNAYISLIEFVFGISNDGKKVIVNIKSSNRNVTDNYYSFLHGMGSYTSIVSQVTSYTVMAGYGSTDGTMTGKLLHERLA